MELINNILSKLNNWCFNFWVGFGNRAGWIRNAYNNPSNNKGIIFCNLSLKHQIKLKLTPRDAAILKKEKESPKRDNYTSGIINRRIKRKNFESGPKKSLKDSKKGLKKGSERGPKS